MCFTEMGRFYKKTAPAFNNWVCGKYRLCIIIVGDKKMYKIIRTIAIGIFIFAVVAMRITRHFGLQKWEVSLGLIGFAVLLYLLNIGLIQYFIKSRTPDFASSEEVIPPGVQKWEMTAGLGIVPKWVSVIGLLSISALITAVLPWIVGLLKG